MKQKQLLFLLALLITAATGAWAQSSASAYSNALNTDELFSQMTKIDANNDGSNDMYGLWLRHDNLVTYMYSSANAADDWLVTPGLELKAGVTYTIALEARKPAPQAHTYTETFEVKVGSGATADNLSAGTVAIATTEVTTSWMTYRGTFTPTQDGTYYVGIHATSPVNQNSFSIRNLVVGVNYYTLSLADNTKDAGSWKGNVNDAETDVNLPITKLNGGEKVTLKYTGRLKVKGVTATTDAAAAIQPFSVSDNTKVFFAPGNLQYNASEATYKWRFAENQYDYLGVRNVSTWIDLFGWGTWTGSTPNPTNSSSTNSQYSFDSGDFVQESLLADADQRDYDWRTLTKDEWVYLFNTRTTGGTVFDTPQARYAHATVNTDGTSVIGIILFPDGTDIASSEVTAAGPVNSPSECATKCTTAQWKALAAKGCVFLPAAGHRNGQAVDNAGKFGDYWSSVASGADNAYRVDLGSGILVPAANNLERSRWFSVRLVREAATSDVAAKTPATVTTAPTGAAVVGVGKSTALVSGGEADGGTLRYAVTTTNTKPTSTDGFSATVPTAEDITASGKVYVWYYVKGDNTHSDSEIAATAIEVPVADIVWDGTNVSDLEVFGNFLPYTKEGIKLSGNAQKIQAKWYTFEDPTQDGISFNAYASGGFTFTAPTSKQFTKIEMKAKGLGGWFEANKDKKLGTGWAFNAWTVTWTGSAASTVGLLTDADVFNGTYITYIAFYLSE